MHEVFVRDCVRPAACGGSQWSEVRVGGNWVRLPPITARQLAEAVYCSRGGTYFGYTTRGGVSARCELRVTVELGTVVLSVARIGGEPVRLLNTRARARFLAAMRMAHAEMRWGLTPVHR